MSTISIQSDLWSLLEKSRLLQSDQLQAIAQDPQAQNLLSSNEPEFFDWLVENQWITSYHAQILRSGLSGPFVFENYIVLSRQTNGPLQGAFRARHRSIGHKVSLFFVPGKTESDLDTWHDWTSMGNGFSDDCDSLVTVYHPVISGQYRFLVADDIRGSALQDKLPAKGRFEKDQACLTVLDVALALSELHSKGIAHGQIGLDSIWIVSGNRAKLWPSFVLQKPTAKNGQTDQCDASDPRWYRAYDADDSQSSEMLHDIYSLGCILLRLLGSKPPARILGKSGNAEFQSSAIRSISKYQFPSELIDLVRSMLDPDPNKRCRDIETAIDALRQLTQSVQQKPYETQSTEAQYRSWLKQASRDAAAELLKNKSEVSLGNAAKATLNAINEQRDVRQLNRNATPKWIMPTGIAIGIFTLCSAVFYIAYTAGQTKLGADSGDTGNNKNVDSDSSSPADDPPDNVNTKGADPENVPPDVPVLSQRLVEDDGEKLWQSPTSGGNVDFNLLPSAARIVFSIRPSLLNELDEGQRVIDSLGPEFKSFLQSWDNGPIEWMELDHLLISLHTGTNNQYEACTVAGLPERLTEKEIIERFPNAKESARSEFGILFKNGDQTFFLPLPKSSEGSENLQFQKIVFAPESRLNELLENGPANNLTGPMLKMSRWADHDRHFSMFFLRSALFTDEGQQLMQGALGRLNRPLDLFLTDQINGVFFSLHLDHGSYLELMLSHTVDVTTDEMKSWLDGQLSSNRDKLINYVSTLSSNEHWNPVKARYPAMLTQLTRQTRIGVEHQQVTANCWLPPMAIDNLFVASELTLLSTPGQSFVVEKPKVPGSLDELLKTNRSVEIVSQDLINCIANLKTEITDDYGNLPFEFVIKMLGNDLRTDGITQNQRISDFIRKDQPFAQILTEMLFQANPDKNATSPKDPRCKLIWVVAPDPENTDRTIILITTRAAAARNNWDLPEPFREE